MSIKSARTETISERIVNKRNIFNSLKPLPPEPPSYVEYLIVAGGASGAIAPNIGCAGGGAGGAIDGNTSVSLGTAFTVTIGAGGVSTTSPQRGFNGSNSAIDIFSGSTFTAIGGGTGGYYNTTDGYVSAKSGGSGGGASWNGSNFTTFGTGTAGQGNNGGPGVGYEVAGGGGGAGAAGGTGSGTSGGVGGIGIDWKSLGTYYAGGGGGASSGSTQSTGGLGGGGSGGKPSSVNTSIMNGSVNTGGGGGGASYAQSPTWSAGSGGSGVVIIRYPDTFTAASATTGSPTVTTSGGYRYYTFTGSGSITF